MISNLAMIGLRPQQSNTAAFAASSADNIASQQSCPPGFYAIAEYPGGPELWFHFAEWRTLLGFGRKKKAAIGFTPFHKTASDVYLTVEHFEQTRDESPFSGRCFGYAGGEEDDRLCFQLVDFANFSNLDSPFAARAAVICLADRAEAFESVEAFLAAQNDDNRMPPAFFLPVGSLAEEGADLAGVDKAMAMLAGQVLSIKQFEYHTSYLQMAIETPTGTFDVFAEAEQLDGEVTVGGIVRAMGWMFGRFLAVERT